MQTAVLCYAPSDAQFADELGVFLEVNCPLTVSHQESGDLIEAVEQGLSDITLVLLSPESVPTPWKRERWEPVFLKQPSAFGTTIAFLLLGECKFPELLRRTNFFDLSADKVAGQRRLKRWLLEQAQPIRNAVELPHPGPSPDLSGERLQDLLRSLVDQPGVRSDLSAGEALAFAHLCKQDFEGVFWIDCTHRSRAGVLGDVANSLGLRLSGTVDRNRIAVEDLCDGRRCLFIFENMPPEHRDSSELGMKTSVILTASLERGFNPSFEESCELFSGWTRNSGDCLRALGAAHWYLSEFAQARGAGSWGSILQLGSSMVAFLKHWDRLAEAHEVLELLLESAQLRADFATMHRLRWEQSWILEHWNERVALNVASESLSEPNQLSFHFG